MKKREPKSLLIIAILFLLTHIATAYESLYSASEYSSIKDVIRLLNKKQSTNNTDTSGSTPLFVAGFYNTNSFPVIDSIITILIANNADITIRDNKGNSVLHWAMKDNTFSYERIIRLLQEGVDINAHNSRGETPLILASKLRESKNITLLLQKGADITLTDSLGKTALHYAEERGNLEVLSALRRGVSKEVLDLLESTEYTFSQEHQEIDKKNISKLEVYSALREGDYKGEKNRYQVDNWFSIYMKKHGIGIALATLYLLGSLYTREKVYRSNSRDNWMLPINSTISMSCVGGALGFGTVLLMATLLDDPGAFDKLAWACLLGAGVGSTIGLLMAIEETVDSNSPFLYYSAPFLYYSAPLILLLVVTIPF